CRAGSTSAGSALAAKSGYRPRATCGPVPCKQSSSTKGHRRAPTIQSIQEDVWQVVASGTTQERLKRMSVARLLTIIASSAILASGAELRDDWSASSDAGRTLAGSWTASAHPESGAT